MKQSRRITITTSAVLVVCLLGSVLSLRRVDKVRTGATLQEVLYISSPKLLKHLSLGYDGLLADVYWTRAVQYFGERLTKGSEHFDLLAPLLEITTTLDPHLMVAYEYGANFLAPKPPFGAGAPDRAVQLTEFGIRNNPDQWHLYYDLGFVYYMELKDYGKATKAFSDGAKLPSSHQVMAIMPSARMAERSGDVQTARMLWNMDLSGPRRILRSRRTLPLTFAHCKRMKTLPAWKSWCPSTAIGWASCPRASRTWSLRTCYAVHPSIRLGSPISSHPMVGWKCAFQTTCHSSPRDCPPAMFHPSFHTWFQKG